VVSTVAAGRGWSIVPDHCAARAATEGRAVIVRHPRSSRRVRNLIYVVTRAGASEHPAVAHIIKALRSDGGRTITAA
jgi:LysR family transcriptional regulator, cyn operon transcriptional activator